MSLTSVFGVEKPVIGMVHLRPLPGSPFFRGNIDEVISSALKDAEALSVGGVDGIIVENFGDRPYYPDKVPAHVIALMSVVGTQIKKRFNNLKLGVNVLRNDALAAMGVATALEAEFIRVNIHTGVMVTDQGIIQGKAHENLRYRSSLNSRVKIFADVLVKHAVPLGNQEILQMARNAFHLGKADALIITGISTGTEANINDVRIVKNALNEAPILVGSGVNLSNIDIMLENSDGVIVGTFFKKNGMTTNPVEISRVKSITNRAKKFR